MKNFFDLKFILIFSLSIVIYLLYNELNKISKRLGLIEINFNNMLEYTNEHITEKEPENKNQNLNNPLLFNYDLVPDLLYRETTKPNEVVEQSEISEDTTSEFSEELSNEETQSQLLNSQQDNNQQDNNQQDNNQQDNNQQDDDIKSDTELSEVVESHDDNIVDNTLEEFSNDTDNNDLENNQIYSNDNEDDNHTSNMESLEDMTKNIDELDITILLKNNKLIDLQKMAGLLEIDTKHNNGKRKTKLALAQDIIDKKSI
jgi:hypothetical protein